jgi:hypothetical protein
MTPRFILVGLAALAACGQQPANTYPPQYELNFMRACQAQGPPSGVCPCTWEKIEREIPPDQFAAFERLPANEQVTHPVYSQLERYALECAGESDPPPQAPPTP